MLAETCQPCVSAIFCQFGYRHIVAPTRYDTCYKMRVIYMMLWRVVMFDLVHAAPGVLPEMVPEILIAWWKGSSVIVFGGTGEVWAIFSYRRNFQICHSSAGQRDFMTVFIFVITAGGIWVLKQNLYKVLQNLISAVQLHHCIVAVYTYGCCWINMNTIFVLCVCNSLTNHTVTTQMTSVKAARQQGSELH